MRHREDLIRPGIAYEIAKDDGGAPHPERSDSIAESALWLCARFNLSIEGEHKAEALAHVAEGIEI